MSNESGFSFESQQPDNQIKEVSQEEIARVQDDQKKAKKVVAEIKKQKNKDIVDSKILSLIFKNIQDDWLVLKFFSYYKNHNIVLSNIFILFYPFMNSHIDFELPYTLNIKRKDIVSISDYTQFLSENLSKKSLLFNDDLIELIVKIIYYFNLSDVNFMDFDDNQKSEYLSKLSESIKNEVFKI